MVDIPLTTDKQLKMDAELKAKWLEALRSGRYDQATGQLRREGSFCCLGVLCDVADHDAWDSDEWNHGTGEDEELETAELPDGFRNWVNISTLTMAQLISMNDDQRMSFAEIADFIERNL